MQHDYKGFSPGVTMETVTEEDWRNAPALQETPVTSAICEPANGAQLEEGTDEVPGLLSAHTNACPVLLAGLCCAVLCCAVLCCAVLCCAVLCCAVLCRAGLACAAT